MKSTDKGVKVVNVEVNGQPMATLVNEKGEYPLDVWGNVLLVEPRTIDQHLGFSVGIPKELPACLLEAKENVS